MIGIFAVLADGKRTSPCRLQVSPRGATTLTADIADLAELVHRLAQNRPIGVHRFLSTSRLDGFEHPPFAAGPCPHGSVREHRARPSRVPAPRSAAPGYRRGGDRRTGRRCRRISTSSPRCITAIRSQTCAATRRSWVMNRHRQAEPIPDRCEEVENLRLHRDVERRYRFVGHQDFGVEGQRPRDADPLALAAGELVRKTLRHAGVEPPPARAAPRRGHTRPAFRFRARSSPPRSGAPPCAWGSAIP